MGCRAWVRVVRRVQRSRRCENAVRDTSVTAAGILNLVANDPDVLRSVAPGLSVLDLSSFFEQPGNLMFGDFDGVVLFTPLAEDATYYEMHLMFTERRRGKALLTQTRSAIT